MMGGGTGSSWWKSQTKRVASVFLDGTTLFKQLAKSSYGIFRKVVEDTHIDDNDFTLPKIVVIGQESAGKSSLLESITKCPVFPRDRAVCTRMPIRLRLIHDANESVEYTFRNETKKLERKEDLLEQLHGLMKSLEDSQGNPIITEDELVVMIRSPSVPNFELIDLPGIREYPADLREKTKNLCQKYMESPDTMMLCVVPAQTPRLTGSQAIGMVLDNKKQANTILALTMTDLVQMDDMEEMVIKRITGTSSELRELGLAGCVAVINRSHLDKLSLLEAEQNERAFFKTLVEDVPEDFPYSLDQVAAAVGSGALIKKLDDLFRGFIVENWRDRALDQVQARRRALQAELAKLGTPVDDLDAIQLIDVIMRQGQLDVIRCFQVAAFQAKLEAAYARVGYEPASSGNPIDNIVYKALKAVEEYTGCSDDGASGAAIVKDGAGVADDDLEGIGKAVSGGESQFLDDIIEAMLEGVLREFSEEAGGDDEVDSLKPGRFEALIDMAKGKLVRRLQQSAPEMHKMLREAALETAFQYVPGQRSGDDAGAEIIRGIAEKSMRRVAAYLAFVVAQKLFVDKSVSPVFQSFMDDAPSYMVESDEWQRRRGALQARLQKVEDAEHKVTNIGNLMGPADGPLEGGVTDGTGAQPVTADLPTEVNCKVLPL